MQNRSISDRTLEECWSTLQRVSWNVFRSVRYFYIRLLHIIVYDLFLYEFCFCLWVVLDSNVLFVCLCVCVFVCVCVYLWNVCFVITIIILFLLLSSLFCSFFARMFLSFNQKVKRAFYYNLIQVKLVLCTFHSILFLCVIHNICDISTIYIFICAYVYV